MSENKWNNYFSIQHVLDIYMLTSDVGALTSRLMEISMRMLGEHIGIENVEEEIKSKIESCMRPNNEENEMNKTVKISGFRINIDKTPAKWAGTVFLKSNFKLDATYVTSTKDSFTDAMKEIIDRYERFGIEGINLKMVKEKNNE